jgi:hypothetical protein
MIQNNTLTDRGIAPPGTKRGKRWAICGTPAKNRFRVRNAIGES